MPQRVYRKVEIAISINDRTQSPSISLSCASRWGCVWSRVSNCLYVEFRRAIRAFREICRAAHSHRAYAYWFCSALQDFLREKEDLQERLSEVSPPKFPANQGKVEVYPGNTAEWLSITIICRRMRGDLQHTWTQTSCDKLWKRLIW